MEFRFTYQFTSHTLTLFDFNFFIYKFISILYELNSLDFNSSIPFTYF